VLYASYVSGKTVDGFTLETFSVEGIAFNGMVGFTVHNNEPAEVALTTFGDVINYNGASAWGDVASDGTLNGGLMLLQ
jgi:uncharacterized protein YegJ (DUF2314 family)